MVWKKWIILKYLYTKWLSPYHMLIASIMDNSGKKSYDDWEKKYRKKIKTTRNTAPRSLVHIECKRSKSGIPDCFPFTPSEIWIANANANPHPSFSFTPTTPSICNAGRLLDTGCHQHSRFMDLFKINTLDLHIKKKLAPYRVALSMSALNSLEEKKSKALRKEAIG